MPNETSIPKWDVIAATAREMGVKEEALRKWREREGVPGKWQVPLIVQSKGQLSVNDFPQRESA